MRVYGEGLCENVMGQVVFCDNVPPDVVAGLLFWGVKLSKRSSNGSCMDGGTLFSFSMF